MSGSVAASVRARLANQARADDRPFHELLQYYGLERFLYRLSRSDYRDRFVLKGALMLRVWDAPMTRPTRDIDFLGYTENSIDSLEGIVRAICVLEVEDDGLNFDPQGVTGERVKEDADYEGVRIKFTCRFSISVRHGIIELFPFSSLADQRPMVVRIRTKNQSHIGQRPRAECTLLWGHCSTSR